MWEKLINTSIQNAFFINPKLLIFAKYLMIHLMERENSFAIDMLRDLEFWMTNIKFGYLI